MANNMKTTSGASIFEKTMAVCLESKRATSSSKSKSKIAKKPVLMKESVSTRKMKRKFEDEELVDDEVADDTMDDIEDDIVVVVDPELSTDDISDAGAEAQEIIDNTPDGEIPTTDEYVGDLTYTCPICGNTFFSDVEMSEGDECPVCGDYPSNFVLAGEVQSTDDTDKDLTDDSIEDIGDEVLDDPEELEPSLDEESVKRSARKTSYTKYSIDESTFNPYLNKFIRENYRNAKSFEIKSARLSGNRLSVECKLSFKSGKTKKVTLRVENFKPTSKMIMRAKEDGTFKSESRNVAPFVFKTSMDKRGIIRCEGLNYNLITRAKTRKNESKKVQIFGKLVESKKARNFQGKKRV